jgi:hypothetical protein
MGTVPMGTVDAAMIACRTASISGPVDRSITVSAPYFTASSSLATSSARLDVTAELPMFAFTFTRATLPMAIGSSRAARWWTLAGITSRPRATSARTSSGSSSSRSATKRMAGEISPVRATNICVGATVPVAPRVGAGAPFAVARPAACCAAAASAARGEASCAEADALPADAPGALRGTDSLICLTPYAGTSRIRFNGTLSARAQTCGGHPGQRRKVGGGAGRRQRTGPRRRAATVWREGGNAPGVARAPQSAPLGRRENRAWL